MITADEARHKAQIIKGLKDEEEHRIKTIKIKYSDLFSIIDDRINSAIQNGLFETSLNSINDDGHGVKGIEYYLSTEAFEAIKLIYSKVGYSFREEPHPQLKIMKFICWGI